MSDKTVFIKALQLAVAIDRNLFCVSKLPSINQSISPGFLKCTSNTNYC